MLRFIACLCFLGISGAACAGDLPVLDCVNSGVRFQLVFDANNHAAQISWDTNVAVMFPQYGQIVSAEVSDAAFKLHWKNYAHTSKLSYSISRESGIAEGVDSDGKVALRIKCKQRREGASAFIAPLLSPDADGMIRAACQEFYAERHAWSLDPVSDQRRSLLVNTKSKEVFGFDPTDDTKPFAKVGGAGLDSIQLCEAGDCRKTWVLNLITGGLFPTTVSDTVFDIMGKTQFVCVPRHQ